MRSTAPGLAWIIAGRVPGTIVGAWVVATVDGGGAAGPHRRVRPGLRAREPRRSADPGRGRAPSSPPASLSGVTGTAAGIGGPPIALLYQRHAGPDDAFHPRGIVLLRHAAVDHHTRDRAARSSWAQLAARRRPRAARGRGLVRGPPVPRRPRPRLDAAGGARVRGGLRGRRDRRHADRAIGSAPS